MKQRKGFTLLELTIALAITLIASTAIFAGHRQIQRRTLHQASYQLQADLRYAQRRSIIEGRRFGIQIEPSARRYHVVELRRFGSNNNLSIANIIRTVYLPAGVRINPPSGANNLLHYTGRGTPSRGATITLSNGPFNQTMTRTVSGGRIQVDPITTDRPADI